MQIFQEDKGRKINQFIWVAYYIGIVPCTNPSMHYWMYEALIGRSDYHYATTNVCESLSKMK